VLEAHVSDGQNLGEEGAAGVVDPDQRAIGHEVDALLPAIVGMAAPADVGEEAGHLAETLVLGSLHKAEGIDEIARELDEIERVAG
jgi:hypothetical protein